MGKNTGNGANIAWFFYAAMGRVGWGITLGALPLPALTQSHAATPARPRVPREHCAFLYAPTGAQVRDYVRGSAPKTPAGT